MAHHLLRRRGESLGTIEAADADEAIETAIKLFGITEPERRRHLVAQKISS